MKNDWIKLRENLFINQDIEFTWPDIAKEKIIEKGRCLAFKEIKSNFERGVENEEIKFNCCI